jgi:anti-sigma regulatory factor (Ser/Thr protein kinase)
MGATSREAFMDKENTMIARTGSADSVVVLDKFIQATRDSGYKDTVSALSELVDNSLQASARRIAISIAKTGAAPEYPLTVTVEDDGVGMDAATLRHAMRFGGSSRFGDRSGLGRYGMGLPNASLSQARRLEVYSWQESGRSKFTYLDVDEIVAGEIDRVPAPRPRSVKRFLPNGSPSSGTIVCWLKCDRLDNKRVSTIERKLSTAIGRIFRYFLWDGVKILINGKPVEPVDPLYLEERSRVTGGTMFGKPQEFEVLVDPERGPSAGTGTVTVCFSELPVTAWHGLPNPEKRRLGILNGAGVSIVRAGREIDYGWFFMGGKRRENYDDWWRCEVSFGPELDEAFGITHTKQQVRPKSHLQEALGSALGDVARALNMRVRWAHREAKTCHRPEGAVAQAAQRESELPDTPPRHRDREVIQTLEHLRRRHPVLREPHGDAEGEGRHFALVEDDGAGSGFFSTVCEEGSVVAVLNPRHAFYKRLYGPLSEDDRPEARALQKKLQFLLLSAARAEATMKSKAERRAVRAFLDAWGTVLDVYLR